MEANAVVVKWKNLHTTMQRQELIFKLNASGLIWTNLNNEIYVQGIEQDLRLIVEEPSNVGRIRRIV